MKNFENTQENSKEFIDLNNSIPAFEEYIELRSELFAKYQKILDIDDYLGKSANRFFGYGYKRVTYNISDVIFGVNVINATVGIDYPQDWSIKKKQLKLKPHLSSIDVLLLSTHLAGRILAKTYGGVDRYSLTQISINAGKKPLLELDFISAHLVCNTKFIDGNQKIIEFEGRVGNMKVKLEIIKERTFHNVSHHYPLASDYINTGFKKTTHGIKNLSLNSYPGVTAHFKKTGVESHLKNPDILDAFVTSLQLGQVLLYELDGLTRTNSNNLWMRSIKIRRNLRPYAPEIAQAQLDDLKIFEVDQQRWRSAEIVGKLADLNVVCSVAHQLPIQGVVHNGY